MKLVTIFFTSVALFFFTPAFIAAQMCSPGQCMMEPDLRSNMGMISGMMEDMHQLLQSGKLTPAQQKHMLEMMDKMGDIMRDMAGPEGLQKQAQLKQLLLQLQKELQEIKTQMSK